MASILPHYLPQVAILHHIYRLGSVSGFLGQHRNRIDDKGRVSLPKPFRDAAGDGSFVLLQWRRPFLSLLPQDVWASISARLLDYRRSGGDAGNKVLRISANATPVSPDKQGRILIPQWLKEAANLEVDVVLVGALDRVELWNPDDFASAVSSDEPDDFDQFAHQIFG